eukprot:TRINITY_DN9168_c0_g1::TRINITY_DN9168_c0_g1_i1::g.12483::m.12483 TRINITY_DN9168_c0_g1::TRINITY_DN9168_c0_g1_i1::g.12483  ORF type:complete len:123 (-),score=25.73,sp/Q54I57/MYCBP_DICDI/53.41/2e-22,HALZ/PF02183.13/0.0077,DivIC/PF04977.10/3.5e+03,DivIC/PF04977.10/0.0054,Microtub_assoc/PF07989.6/93,Microtub_assoc/PF07989.6/0.073,DUF904/PF06005.7/2e+03,DUF904/PF06005.7/0.022,bZIP_1/PF00170.16/7.1e+02,bZIP_1/PF00170.16/0.07 TRINITY_DN9168_c0_g1_i1:298-624(-)
MATESKKEEFKKYLERSGVIDALTKVLVALYEEPEKPANALDFIKQTLGAPSTGEIESLKSENKKLKAQNVDLSQQLFELKQKLEGVSLDESADHGGREGDDGEKQED